MSHRDGSYQAVAEEVGVEHLLRDINDPLVCSLAGQVKHKMTALNGSKTDQRRLKKYHENVVSWLAESPNQLQAHRAAESKEIAFTDKKEEKGNVEGQGEREGFVNMLRKVIGTLHNLNQLTSTLASSYLQTISSAVKQ